jgi:hypothetical protein
MFASLVLAGEVNHGDAELAIKVAQKFCLSNIEIWFYFALGSREEASWTSASTTRSSS